MQVGISYAHIYFSLFTYLGRFPRFTRFGSCNCFIINTQMDTGQ